MTLEEAIDHVEAVANANCDERAAEHNRQLAGWLKELRELRELRMCERVTTNGDKIRAMSDEELAKFLTEWGNYYYLETLDWLKQEAKEDAD